MPESERARGRAAKRACRARSDAVAACCESVLDGHCVRRSVVCPSTTLISNTLHNIHWRGADRVFWASDDRPRTRSYACATTSSDAAQHQSRHRSLWRRHARPSRAPEVPGTCPAFSAVLVRGFGPTKMDKAVAVASKHAVVSARVGVNLRLPWHASWGRPHRKAPFKRTGRSPPRSAGIGRWIAQATLLTARPLGC